MSAVDSTCTATAIHNHNCNCSSVAFTSSRTTLVENLLSNSMGLGVSTHTARKDSILASITNRERDKPSEGRMCVFDSNIVVLRRSHWRSRFNAFLLLLWWTGLCSENSMTVRTLSSHIKFSSFIENIFSNENEKEWRSLKAIITRVLDSPSVNCVSPSTIQNARQAFVSVLITHRCLGLVPTNQPFTYGYYDEWQ